MKSSQACLTTWQIDLAEVFSSKAQRNTTEENLSRLESFLNAYFLFDRVFVPEKYCGSSFVGALDRQKEIFVFDPRVSGSYGTGSAGEAILDVDPALVFKNSRHLKSKSAGWFQQHIVLDVSKHEREALIEHLRAQGQSVSWFYQVILSEYQALFGLSMLNDAFAPLFASMAQVYQPDITEMPRFAAFLERVGNKAGIRMQRGESAGIFNFELTTGAVEARVRSPAIFDSFLERAQNEDFTEALVNLRRVYQPAREVFRAVAAAFQKCEGGGLVASDMRGREIDEWNGYVERFFGTTDEILLLKSEVAAVEIHTGLAREELFRTLSDRIKARGSLLRLVPPQSFTRRLHKSGNLGALKIENVVPFERRLFRVGNTGYRNKRNVLHKGVASIMSFPLAAGAQLAQENLGDPVIRAFGEERQPHLYMICARPRITVSPEVVFRQGWFDLGFQFQVEGRRESERISMSGVRDIIVDCKNDRTSVLIREYNGDETSWDASLLYQSMTKTRVTGGNPVAAVFGNERYASCEHQSPLKRTDLEVLYIGQSKGRDFDRTAITRLGQHEKWETFYGHLAEAHTDLELWIVLVTQLPTQQLNMTLPGVHDGEHDVQEMLRRVSHPTRIDSADCVNFIEGALISYFKPRYNDKFRKGAFPSRQHASYERLFVSPVDVAAIELETLTSLGCRLYSKSVEPRFSHMKMCQVNAAVDMGQLWAQGGTPL